MSGERGAALVLALVVAAALTVLGVALLGLADVESRIAAREDGVTQAAYAGEAAVQAVKVWFDRPAAATPFPFPPPRVIVRGRYKLGVDRDGDGADDVFDRPYGPAEADAFVGTASDPDVRIEDREFLATLSEALFGERPPSRIARIDVFAPPRLRPHGIATVRVVARVERRGTLLAERTVQALLDEIPYRGVRGPLHACADLVFRTPPGELLPLRWGPVVATGAAVVSSVEAIPPSLPRSAMTALESDPLWATGFAAPFGAYRARLMTSGEDVGDPWFRFVVGGPIGGFPTGAQPFPSAWATWDGAAEAPGPFADLSHVLQGQAVACPEYEYGMWKTVAQAGGRRARYFAWSEGDRFREDGRGEPQALRDLTDGQSGIYFFDTRDGQPPRPDGGNLTPPIRLSGAWSFEGVLYLNAESFRADVSGTSAALLAPGEPFEDADGDGAYDNASADGTVPAEEWIDLDYPSSSGAPFAAAPVGGTRDLVAPHTIGVDVALNGLLYTSGRFEATGAAVHSGSIVARRGVSQDEAADDVPEIYWNPALASGPPAAWDLPRVVVVGWLHDP